MEEQTRDCKACIYSKNGKCAGTEECHECMWENKFKQKSYNEVEDCISRQAVLEVLNKNRYRFNISQEGYCEGKVLWSENLIKDNACKEIEQLPPVTPKEKTGAWVPVDAEPHDIYECNACGWLLYYEDTTDYKYCPNCGARMT